MKPSFGAKLFSWILKISGFKKRIEKVVVKNNVPRSKKGFLPAKITTKYKAEEFTVNGRSVVTFESKEKVNQQHIICFHGGVYLFEASQGHWGFAEKIVKKQFCRMTMVDYPLAPEQNYKETFEMVEKSYAELRNKYPNDEFIFMGDSAGGGLSLALTQKLIKEGKIKPPAKMILLSPWLDITMSNPEVNDYVDKDHILTLSMLIDGGLKYADGDDPNHYLLSPINGDFTNLPKTIVFYGSEEVFVPDCRKMQAIVGENNRNFIFKEYQHMQHAWPIFPIPEGNLVVEDIAQFMTE